MTEIEICCGKKCLERGAKSLREAAEKIVREKNLAGKIKIGACGCVKKCKFGPNIKIVRNGKNVIKSGISPEKIEHEICSALKSPPGAAQKKLNSLLSGGF